MKHVPTVVLVGRMNVGKSTLFNRLSSSIKSMTLDYHGVTRDVIRDIVTWRDRSFELIDTGGLSCLTAHKTTDQLLHKVWEQVWNVVKSADVIVMVTDASIGLTPEDREIMRQLRRWSKEHIIIAANKSDNRESEEHIHEFKSLGGTAICSVSAEHSRGMNDLLDEIVTALPAGKAVAEKPRYRVVILGRPNVGKSSLMNHVVRQERSIVFDMPGTTREAVGQPIMFYKEHIMITDTPGLRRKSTIDETIEQNMAHSSLQALTDNDIVVLVVDGTEGALVDQDIKLGCYAFVERHKALIVVINKDDLVDEDTRKSLLTDLDKYRHFLKKVPVKTISCETGKNVGTILPLIQEVWERHSQTFSPATIFHLFMREMEQRPLIRNEQRLLVFHVEQVSTAPITFRLSVNEPSWFGASQLAFFENILRKNYDLIGVPVRFFVRKNK